MMKQCPKCKRILELNEDNFRRSCDGYWRNTCRKCENQHKREKYIRDKAKAIKKPDPTIALKERRLKAAMDKYGREFKILEQYGYEPDISAGLADKIFEKANELSRKCA